MLSEVSKEDIIRNMRADLGLPVGTVIDEATFAALVRREAAIKCPCTTSRIVSAVCEALSFQQVQDESIQLAVEDVISKLLILGDLVELDEILADGTAFKRMTLFAGYPSFVVRPDNSVFIFGIVPDENSPIEALAERIIYHGCRRSITQLPDEDLIEVLEDHGLFHKPVEVWLKLPKLVRAECFLKSIDKKMDAASPSAPIDGLLVFEKVDNNHRRYTDRWKSVHKELNGRYVSKRPTNLGLTWCYTEFMNGVFRRSIDLPAYANGCLQRPCDVAWLLNLAIDTCDGKPQGFNITKLNDQDYTLEFYAPIPLWAERRLIAVGEKTWTKSSLFAYNIPEHELRAQERFLQEYLWISKL